MKALVFTALAAVMLCACNSIPDKSIFEPLDSEVLGGIIRKDSLFASFYEEIRDEVKDFNEIEKARHNDITYRRLYAMFRFAHDTAEINPLQEKWIAEWNGRFGRYEAKADSVIGCWIDYSNKNSLDRFVQIEFAAIDKEYYSYGYEVRNVNFAFKLTPLIGAVDQLCFNYRYAPKIDDVRYAEKHSCISTQPFSSPVIRYWEVDYADEKRLKNISSSDFSRDYDILFEVTEIRRNGKNYSMDDLEIPGSIARIMETDAAEYPYLYEIYRDAVITDLLCPEYEGEYDFMQGKMKLLLKEKFPKEFAFGEYVGNR